jgi:acetolactate synthase small subunit
VREDEMGAIKENPRYNVVSLRVTNEERELLLEMQRMTRKNMSQILREAMQLITVTRTPVART